MNEYFSGGPRGGEFDAMYYWNQFHPILAAVAILLIGWILALIIAAGIKKLLEKLGTNQRLSSTTGHRANIESIVSRIVFWIVMIIAIIGALNVLNLTSVSGPFSNMIQQFLLFIPQLLAAVAVGFVGWIVATLVKAGMQKLLDRTQLDEKLSADVGVSPISKNISDIVYWLILLLFLPIVLSILGLNGLLFPIQNMVSEVVSYLPNIFIAVVIVFVGYILAKIVRGIIEGLVGSLNLQHETQKIGFLKHSNLPKVLGSFVFAVIIITSLIIAFEALGITAISQPATAMLYEIMNAIPHIIAAGLILILAYVVSRFVANLVVDVLAGTGVDELPAKMDAQRFLGTTKVSTIVGYMIVFFTMLFAVSEAANRLGFEQVSVLISMFIQFGANILLGAVILMIGFWLANIVAKVIGRGEYNSSRWLANLVRILIMGLVIAMGLRAMGIADSIVNLAFGLTLGAVAVAFALAFGLGGRQPAERVLTDLIDKCKKDAKEPNPLHQDNADLMTSTLSSDSISAHAAQAFTEHGGVAKGFDPSVDKSSELGMNGGTSPATSDLTKPATESRFPLSNQDGDGSQVQNSLSNPTPASLTTAPQDDITSTDQAVPDSVRIDPQQPPKNNPFGSTGESESKVDIHTDKKPNLNDDNK
ncbi:mechanosensitive ion channel [Acinetobacter sp. TSRC1-2]|uniref:mechanosensitive ion channel n=1 Tax=unclassified Acinetobacter TaxID=196816 RepID=UPI003CF6A6BD